MKLVELLYDISDLDLLVIQNNSSEGAYTTTILFDIIGRVIWEFTEWV